ncbi:hypothetical protein LguiB_034012 [Lonicera macranthoides]
MADPVLDRAGGRVGRKGNLYRYLAEFKSGIERKAFVNQSVKAYQGWYRIGDYLKYVVEFKGDIERKEVVDESLKAYQIATTKAES